MPETTTINHVEFMFGFIDADGQARCDKFNNITLMAQHCTEHRLKPSVIIGKTYKSYGGLTGTAKTWVNEMLAAQKCIKHYKSVDAYEKHVTAFNEAQKDAGKKQVFSHQYFQNQVSKSAPSAPPKPSSNLDKAVKQGIITASQAKALAALGIK